MKLAAISLILLTYSKPASCVNVRTCAEVRASQDESSEQFIGEWIEARGVRDQIFLATKVRLQRPF